MTSTIPSWARKGVKVVCIEAGAFARAARRGFIAPKQNVVYTIREIDVDGPGGHIRLREIDNGPANDGFEPSWYVWRFRPAIEPKREDQDLALFTEHLKSPPVSATTRERADV